MEAELLEGPCHQCLRGVRKSFLSPLCRAQVLGFLLVYSHGERVKISRGPGEDPLKADCKRSDDRDK
jgi:hypothetical protein